MAKKPIQKKPPVGKTPKPESTRTVAAEIGGGEARLYDAHKQGLPDLATMPPEKELADCQWWLVHFPSRRAVAVLAGRLEGMRLLKKLETGKDEAGLLPPPKIKKSPKPASKGRARAGACASAGEDQNPPEKKPPFTDVPDGLSFDAAMKHVFPNQRITGKLEALMEAEKPVYDKEGVLVGHMPDYMTQIAALKLSIEHAQGRAGEKPPPPPDKKRVSYEELEKMILSSPATLAHFESLIARGKEKQAAVMPVEAGPQ